MAGIREFVRKESDKTIVIISFVTADWSENSSFENKVALKVFLIHSEVFVQQN